MTIFTGIIAYIITWWLVLFTVLPWGNTPPEQPGEGHAASAPAHPRLKMKFLATTLISACIWLVIYGLMRLELIDFNELARRMAMEDLGQ